MCPFDNFSVQVQNIVLGDQPHQQVVFVHYRHTADVVLDHQVDRDVDFGVHG